MFLLSPQREPSIDLLEAFVEHWKGITHYYIESTGGAWFPPPLPTLAGGGGSPAGSGEEGVGRVTMQVRDAGVLDKVTAVAEEVRLGDGPTLTFWERS